MHESKTAVENYQLIYQVYKAPQMALSCAQFLYVYSGQSIIGIIKASATPLVDCPCLQKPEPLPLRQMEHNSCLAPARLVRFWFQCLTLIASSAFAI